MTDSDFENHKILLDDARNAYYTRLGDFNNLMAKSGVIVAAIGAFIALSLDWFKDLSHLGVVKVAVGILLTAAIYLAFRAMFVKEMYLFSIKTARENLKNNPTMQTSFWVNALLEEYQRLFKEANYAYENCSSKLMQSTILFVASLIIVLIVR